MFGSPLRAHPYGSRKPDPGLIVHSELDRPKVWRQRGETFQGDDAQAARSRTAFLAAASQLAPCASGPTATMSLMSGVSRQVPFDRCTKAARFPGSSVGALPSP